MDEFTVNELYGISLLCRTQGCMNYKYNHRYCAECIGKLPKSPLSEDLIELKLRWDESRKGKQ